MIRNGIPDLYTGDLRMEVNTNIVYQYLNLFIQIEILGRCFELDVKAV